MLWRDSIPWNYPIMMWCVLVRYNLGNLLSSIIRAWKTAPALAVGCTVVMKPSELTSITALVSRFNLFQLQTKCWISWSRKFVNYLSRLGKSLPTQSKRVYWQKLPTAQVSPRRTQLCPFPGADRGCCSFCTPRSRQNCVYWKHCHRSKDHGSCR